MRTLSLLVLLIATPAFAQDNDHVDHHSDDETEVLSTANQFTGAIAAADRSALEAILSPDALILESGGIETREEYFRPSLWRGRRVPDSHDTRTA